jgi:hypothetical protein
VPQLGTTSQRTQRRPYGKGSIRTGLETWVEVERSEECEEMSGLNTKSIKIML